jgi:hypothetical protein
MSSSVTGKKVFSPGRFFGINNVSNPTPVRAYVPQDMSVDFKQATKELFGEKKFSVAVAAGEMSITGKVTMGAQNARILADLLFNVAGVAGTIIQVDKEAGTIPGTPYQITVANGATWTTDLGVMDASTGKVYTRVASSPATGQYSVATGGIYTFAAADTTNNVLISYLYTSASSGEKLTMSNQLQGPAGSFTSVMVFPYSTDQDVLTLNNAILTDSSIATKLGDFAKPTMGFMASTDSSDTLGTYAFAQAA